MSKYYAPTKIFIDFVKKFLFTYSKTKVAAVSIQQKMSINLCENLKKGFPIINTNE